VEEIEMRIIATLIFLALAASAQAASTSDSDMPDEVRALLMKEKAKGNLRASPADASSERSKKAGGTGGGKSGCNLDIGNVNSGGSAAPRQVTTIVTGPVIQMNNKCN
jgi:hypothetical protein